MAIKVGYFEDTDECYSEGPFVMTLVHDYRIEVGKKGDKCPRLPDASIYKFLEERGMPSKSSDTKLMSHVVDILNAKVKDGTLTLVDGRPIWDGSSMGWVV